MRVEQRRQFSLIMTGITRMSVGRNRKTKTGMRIIQYLICNSILLDFLEQLCVPQLKEELVEGLISFYKLRSRYRRGYIGQGYTTASCSKRVGWYELVRVSRRELGLVRNIKAVNCCSTKLIFIQIHAISALKALGEEVLLFRS